jgi:hypothetical protein
MAAPAGIRSPSRQSGFHHSFFEVTFCLSPARHICRLWLWLVRAPLNRPPCLFQGLHLLPLALACGSALFVSTPILSLASPFFFFSFFISLTATRLNSHPSSRARAFNLSAQVWPPQILMYILPDLPFPYVTLFLLHLI